MFKVQIGDRNYRAYDYINQTTMIGESLPIDPVALKLFHNDIIEYDGSNVKVMVSSLRSAKHISGVLVLSDNVSYGKHKNKKYYRCLPDDSRLPSFLIPLNFKNCDFSKKPVNEYAIFSFDNWDGKHPVGTMITKIGGVDKLANFYEYQLYCKSLNSSITTFMKDAIKQYKSRTEDEYTDIIMERFPSICDRREYNVFSIDPATSTDYDDAMSIQQYSDYTELSIYISNVTIWIEILELWESFSQRVATIYLPDRKRPMLPTILSDCLCSLQEKQNRFAIVLDLHIKDGNIIESKYSNCLINVNKNFRYEEKSLLSDVDYKKIFDILREISPKYKYMGKIKNSHDVVAYAMILFNWWTGQRMMSYQNGIYRSLILNPDIEIPNSLPDDVQMFVRIWNSSAGQYVPYKSDMKHDVLKVDAYIHMSSPIRRLIDLLNIIQFQKNLDMIELSDRCTAFYEKWFISLEYINTTMRAIRKVQSDCALLAQCTSDPDLLTETYVGYVYDKIYRNDNMYQYIVYLPHFKLNTRVALKEDISNYTPVNFKLFMFMEKANFKHKIRLQYISKVA
jgi:exoribonuclease R|tara:strand:- start:1794 stop:3488 length:1695 start_codon:yes stop_codon:yes gene_type:complete